MTEPFILDPDYTEYTPDKLKYESVIPEDIRAYIENRTLIHLIMWSQFIGCFLMTFFVSLIDALTTSTVNNGIYLLCWGGPIVVLLIFSLLILLPLKLAIPSIAVLPFIVAVSATLDSTSFFNLALLVYFIYTVVAFIVVMVMYLKKLIPFLRGKNRCVRMVRYGVLLDGEVVESIGEYKKEAYRENCYVTVRYKYMTLSGYEREGTQTCLRNDLKHTPLLPKGTPVKVLYADEKAVIML